MKNNLIKFTLLLLSFVAFSQLQAQEPARKGKANPEKAFAKMDTNGDQVIDMQEFMAAKEMRAAKRAEKGKETKKGNPEKTFGKMDADQSGGVSMDEFMAFKESKMAKRAKRKARKAQSGE